MQKSVGFSLRTGLAILFLALFGVSTNASAEGKGGEGAYLNLEAFTVNLAGLHQVIQLTITLKPAKPTIAEKLKLYEPAIRHEIILLLSVKTPEQLQTSEGKQKLIVEIRNAANKAVGMNSKEGVAEVLFESIIIQ